MDDYREPVQEKGTTRNRKRKRREKEVEKLSSSDDDEGDVLPPIRKINLEELETDYEDENVNNAKGSETEEKYEERNRSNLNNANMRSFRYSAGKTDPFNPEFNAFYPMRRSKTNAFEFFDDEDIYQYGLTRLLLKVREGTQFIDDYLWSKTLFRVGVLSVVVVSVIVGLFRVIFLTQNYSSIPVARVIVFMLILVFGYVASFLERERKDEDSKNMILNQSNIKETLSKGLKTSNFGIKSFSILHLIKSCLIYVDELLPVILRLICTVVTVIACLKENKNEVTTSLCIVLGIMVFMSSFHGMNVDSLNSLLASLMTSMLSFAIIFKTNMGRQYVKFWYNFVGTHTRLLSEALLKSLQLTSIDLTDFAPEFFLVFYDPFYVAVAAILYQLGLHQFLFVILSQLGLYFFRVSTVVMGCIICGIFFDYAAFLLWMSPLLAVADDHELFNIIVSVSCGLNLPLAFIIANRYGLRNPYISAFGPINSFISIIVVKAIYPSRKKMPLKLDLNLIRRREQTDFFETISVAIANSAKYVMVYIGGFIIARGIDNFFFYLKKTTETLMAGSVLGAGFIDKMLNILSTPLLYILGFPEEDMPIVSKFIFRNLITFKTTTIDEFMHHVALRWLSDCWSSAQWLTIDYNGNEVFFKSTQEQAVYLNIQGYLMKTKSEYLMMHLLLNFVNVGNLFTFCAIMSLLLPHRIVNIRSMMGSMFFGMILSIFLSNIMFRIFYMDDMTGLECVNEKNEPMCKELMSKFEEILFFIIFFRN